VNEALVDLLRDLGPEEWSRPTVHPRRDAKDLAAHLLHGSLRRVGALRDGYRRPGPPIGGLDDLIAFIQKDNSDFMAGMRRVSPQILIEMIEIYDRQMMAAFDTLDPWGPGLGVAWAGEDVSHNWFDIAREYTEKWHHQQQLRDGTGRPLLYDPTLLDPALQTFARGLPHAYRRLDARDGDAIEVLTTGASSLMWSLRRKGGTWTLWQGATPDATTSISLTADLAWRLWTKSAKPERARRELVVRGDPANAEPLLNFVAVMA
jgi:uncharacterized protein (TIGR03083 family)